MGEPKREASWSTKKSLQGGMGQLLLLLESFTRLKGMLQDWGQMCIQLRQQRQLARVPCSCTPVPPFAKLQ